MTWRFNLKQSSYVSFYHYQIQHQAEITKAALDLTKRKVVKGKLVEVEEEENEEVVITLYQLKKAQKEITELQKTLEFHGLKDKDAWKKFVE